MNTLHGTGNRINSMVLSPNGQRLFSSCDNQNFEEWDTWDGLHVRTVISGNTTSLWTKITSMCLSKDGQRLFFACSDKTIKEWDTNSGCFLRSFSGHDNIVLSMLVNDDEKRLLQLASTKRSKSGIYQPASVPTHSSVIPIGLTR